MGNGFAYAVLACWPLLAIYWYRTKNIQTATIVTILGGFMLLPVKTEVDLPMIPAMGKHTIPVVAALVGCWFIKKQPISYIRELGELKYLVLLLIITPFITAALNSDSLIIGARYIKGLTYYDGLSTIINQFLIITPFFIGRQFFKTYQHQLLMFKLLVVAGLLYSIPMLFEVRMSPQLHSWVYDYFPHSFGQQKRFGGFRPVVFMGHGLLVSFFAAIVVLSATVLWKNKMKIRNFSPPMVSYYLFTVLVLCKSIASLAYGAFAFVLVKNIKPALQHKIAVAMVCLALFYPFMSILKIFPHQTIMNVANSISAERAESLQFRFDNEDILLEHGRERFFFGWGGWGRNRVYDDETGRDLSVTDGRWIITFGGSGIVGFIAEFGLLAIVVFRAKKAAKYLKEESEKNLLAAHALMIGLIMIDQLPNASLAPWLWLLAGILLGRSEQILMDHKVKSSKDRYVQ